MSSTSDSIDFLTHEVTQADIAAFGATKVNLPAERAKAYRDQVNVLRSHLERYIAEHQDFGLAKMLLSGSLAKGTSLRTLNDIDVGMYVKGDSAPAELEELLRWLEQKLRTTYHQMSPQNIKIDGPCVVISYAVTGIDIEVSPIYYMGDPQWRGYLWDRSTGEKILTSIPLHLDFIRKRKEKQPIHFAQAIRFLKWWVKQREKDTHGFRFRSFLVELVMAKLADDGISFANYHLAVEQFFQYVQRTGLRERIAFTDNYASSKLPARQGNGVEIIDPVNPANNVARDITSNELNLLVSLSSQALDDLSYASTCQTKGAAIECWQSVMGNSFTA
jgi:tRNA nucleotidyltransferase (CCA-adding enzyme)